MTDEPRFNFRISGGKVESETLARMIDGLERLGELPGLHNFAHAVDSTEAGWQITGSGESADPAIHKAALTTLGDLASAPDANTGSSEFASPFGSDANFHASPAAAGAAPASEPAAGS